MSCTHQGEKLGRISICHGTTRAGRARKEYQVCVCAVYGRCLPHLAQWEPQHLEVEARLYQLCAGCRSKAPPPPTAPAR